MSDDEDLDALIPGAPKILTIDLERLPGREPERDIWSPRDVKYRNYSHPDKWIELPRTLCYSARWLGSRNYLFAAAWENPDDPWHTARQAWDLLDEAAAVVTFNGDRADLPWVYGDFAQAGIRKPSPFKSIDLYKVARRSFAFESKSLRHLCTRLGVVNKDGRYDATEARAAMAGDEALQRRLRRYNQADVRATEAVLENLRAGGWVHEMPHMGLFTGSERSCWNCGSERLTRNGRAYTPVTAYARYSCEDCGASSRNGNRQSNVTMRVAR